MSASNIILGSGLIGLLAKELLGDNWDLIPFSKSRFYSFFPALADNHFSRDERLDDFMAFLGGTPTNLYTVRFNLGGTILDNVELVEPWLDKEFGEDTPPQALPYWRQRRNYFVYNLRANVLYQQLLRKHREQIMDALKAGKTTSIREGQLIRERETRPYEQILSTIPLPELLKLLGQHINLRSRQLWFWHIASTDLDFEGHNQLLIVDDAIDFTRACNIARGRFLISGPKDISLPGTYFSQFAKQVDVLDGTTIPAALPCGPTPDLRELERLRIRCIGAFSQWDPCADLSTCLLRLLNYKASLRL